MTTPGEVSGVIDVLETLPNTQLMRDASWQLRMAMIVSESVGSTVFGIFDGDGINGGMSTIVPLILLVDTVAIGDHVMVLSVPTSGNYVIRNGTVGNVRNTESAYASPDTQSRNVGGFFDLTVGGQPFACTFTKKYNRTKLEVHHSMQGYVSASGTIMLAALNINGNDYATARLYFNDIFKHMAFSASTVIPRSGEPDIPAGTYEIVARFGREAGAGTVNVDNNNRVSFTVTEVTSS